MVVNLHLLRMFFFSIIWQNGTFYVSSFMILYISIWMCIFIFMLQSICQKPAQGCYSRAAKKLTAKLQKLFFLLQNVVTKMSAVLFTLRNSPCLSSWWQVSFVLWHLSIANQFFFTYPGDPSFFSPTGHLLGCSHTKPPADSTVKLSSAKGPLIIYLQMTGKRLQSLENGLTGVYNSLGSGLTVAQILMVCFLVMLHRWMTSYVWNRPKCVFSFFANKQ